MKEVNYEEYLALERRVEELEKRQTEATRLAFSWAYAVTELPIRGMYLKDDANQTKPLPVYRRGSTDAWQAFTKLAKLIHGTAEFHLSHSKVYDTYRWYRTTTDAPKNQADLTYEQKVLSLEMLNELIPIYNKYYKKANPYVKLSYDPTGVAVNMQVVDENDTEVISK